MKKKFLSMALVLAMTTSIFVGCGGQETSTDTTTTETTTTTDASTTDNTDAETTDDAAATTDEAVTITLGIWPEDTLTDDIAVHEGYVATMKELHPNVTCEPAYYKYSTDTFMPMVEAGTVPTIFETWFTEPQKLIKEGAVRDITDQLAERGWLDKISPAILDILSDENGRVYGIPRDGYALGVMCNVALFEEAGLVDENGYPIYPTTWEELAQTAATIKEKTGAAG